MTRDRARRLAVPLLLAALVAWGLTDVRERAAWDPERPTRHRTDVTVYTAAARALLEGRDPYEAESPRGWHYLYPPLFALLFVPLTGLPPQGQGVAWFLLSLLLAVGSVLEGRRLFARLAPRAPPWLRIAAFLALALPGLNTLQRGQAGFAVLYPLLLGLRLVLTGRGCGARAAGGALLALPVVIKLTPLMPVGTLLVAQAVRAVRRREPGAAGWPLLGGCAGLLAFVVLIPAGAIGPARNAALLGRWVDEVVANPAVEKGRRFTPWTVRNQSFENAVRRLQHLVAHAWSGEPDDRRLDLGPEHDPLPPFDSTAAVALVAAVRVALVLLLLATAVRLARAPPRDRAALFGVACAASLVVSPLAWGHHYVVLYPAALLLPAALHARGSGGRRAARGFAVAVVALPVLHYAHVYATGRAGVLGIGTTLWTLLALGALARAPSRTSVRDDVEVRDAAPAR